MSKLRDIVACLLWFAVGVVLWYPEAFQHKTISLGLWVVYGLSYLVLVALLGWWNMEQDNG